MTPKKDPRDTEREIIALYQSRDESAIHMTAEALGGYCYTVAYNVLSSREDAEELAVRISAEVAKAIAPHVDGYYLMTPFKRVSLMARILTEIRDIFPDVRY